MDCSGFRRKMSFYRLRDGQSESAINGKDSDIFIKTMVRDLSLSAKGNIAAVYTRVYTAVFFQTSAVDELKEMIGTFLPSLAMVVLSLLVQEMMPHVSILLALIVLLFTVEKSEQITTTEVVVSVHLVLVAVFALISRDGTAIISDAAVYAIAAVIGLLTAGFTALEYIKFVRLTHRIRRQFYAEGDHVAYFKQIDGLI